MSTHYSFHNRRHHEHIRQFKRFSAGLGLLIILLLIWFISYFTKPLNKTQPDTSSVRSKVQEPTSEVFRTPYFQFQAGKEWAEDATTSGNGVYIYRAYQSSLIQQDLTIYVNPTISPPKVTRVQPVVIQSDNVLRSDQSISEHCSAAAPAGTKDIISVIFQKVSFVCQSDGTIFEVLVGEENGTGVLRLDRPDGGSTDFIIIYRDLTAQPVGRDLKEIINTFQSR